MFLCYNLFLPGTTFNLYAQNRDATARQDTSFQTAQEFLKIGSQIANQVIDSQARLGAQSLQQNFAPPTPATDNTFKNCNMLPLFTVPSESSIQQTAGMCATPQGQAQLQAQVGPQINQLASFLKDPSGKQTSNIGISCLQDTLQITLAQMNQRQDQIEKQIEALDRLQNQLKNSTDADLKAMSDLQTDLTGRDLPHSTKSAKDIKREQMLDKVPGCRVAFENSQFNGQGLRNIEAAMQNKYTPAGQLLKGNRISTITDSIKKQVSIVASKIDQRGLQDTVIAGDLNSVGGAERARLTSIGSMELALNTAGEKLKDQIQSHLSKIAGAGARAPRLDQRFEEHVARSIRDNDLRTTRVMQACMNQPGRTTGGQSFEDIIGHMKQPGVSARSGGGTTLSFGMRDINQIWNDDERYRTIEEKLAAINKIEKEHGFVLQLPRSFDGRTTYSVAEFYRKIQKDCEARKEYQDAQDDVKVVQSSLEGLKVDVQNFKKNFQSQLLSDLINCSSSSQELSPRTCNMDSVTPESGSFCVKNAVNCSNNITTCFKNVQGYVQQVQKRKETIAQQFNQKVRTTMAQMNGALQNIRQAFEQQAQALKRIFPKADFRPPEEFRIDLPQVAERNDLLDVNLLMADGQGNVRNIANLIKPKLRRLKAAMRQQQESIKRSEEKRISDMAQNYSEQRTALQGLLASCQSAAQTAAQANQQRQRSQQEATEKQLGEFRKAQNFCDSVRTTFAVPGCEGQDAAKLLKDYRDISGKYLKISEDRLRNAIDVCLRAQKNRENKNDNPEKAFDDLEIPKNKHFLQFLCDAGRGDPTKKMLNIIMSNNKNQFINQLEDLQRIDDEDGPEITSRDVRRFINGDIDTLPGGVSTDLLTGNGAGNTLLALRQLNRAKKDYRDTTILAGTRTREQINRDIASESEKRRKAQLNIENIGKLKKGVNKKKYETAKKEMNNLKSDVDFMKNIRSHIKTMREEIKIVDDKKIKRNVQYEKVKEIQEKIKRFAKLSNTKIPKNLGLSETQNFLKKGSGFDQAIKKFGKSPENLSKELEKKYNQQKNKVNGMLLTKDDATKKPLYEKNKKAAEDKLTKLNKELNKVTKIKKAGSLCEKIDNIVRATAPGTETTIKGSITTSKTLSRSQAAIENIEYDPSLRLYTKAADSLKYNFKQFLKDNIRNKTTQTGQETKAPSCTAMRGHNRRGSVNTAIDSLQREISSILSGGK